MSARRSISSVSPARGGGFTMIELLMVVAVLSVLLSILTPTFYGLRKVAGGVVCRANLHYQGAAIYGYLGENGKTFPMLNGWFDISGRPTSDPLDSRPVNKYIANDTDLHHCPADEGSSYDWGGNTNYIPSCWGEGPQLPGNGSSYSPAVVWPHWGTEHAFAYYWSKFGWDASYDVQYPPKKQRDFAKAPEKKVITGDATWWPSYPLMYPNNSWHGDGTKRQYNMLFADWHAEFFEFPLWQGVQGPIEYYHWNFPVDPVKNPWW